ncbi:MAG: ferrochelatase [Granulosicoccus sp.]|nr:ferrochelatase [Granulosicoccus sp.]
MKYLGQPDFKHGTPERLGVLMVNLGTPDAPETAPVRRYLAEFLSDPRIIELPRWLWKTLLHGVILRTRPRRSAAAYREVWTDEGSPLLSISKAQCAAVRKALTSRFGDKVVVTLGMRYGSPSIDSALTELEAHNVRRLVVLPMYPQYSGTTTASVFDAVTSRLQRTRWLPEIRFINQYIDEPGYIAALADSVQQHWDKNGKADLLVTSYHGIPRRYLLNGDPYHCQCYKTTRLLTESLKVPEESTRVVFQSRVGREEWLRPYCDETMKQLPKEGVKSIDILCPGFSADCLETIEEIEQENREYFMENGGQTFNYIPCLNDSPAIVECLTDLIVRHSQGWPEVDPESYPTTRAEEYAAIAERADNLRRKNPVYD